MKIYNDKCHLPFSGYKHEVMWASTAQNQIWKGKVQKFLGMIVDKNMKFD